MELYIKRDNGYISLEEWKAYAVSDAELDVADVREAVNPITKQKLRVEVPGHALYVPAGTNMAGHAQVGCSSTGKEICGEFTYRKGMIGSEDASEKMVKKVREIAEKLHADVYVEDEKIS